MKKIVQNLIMIICFCSFCFFAYKIHNYNKEELEQEKLRDSLIENAIIITLHDEQKNNEHSTSNLPIEVNFETLKKENDDIVAWIYSEGTPINYPVVQAKNNDYYLRRLLDGTYNQAGTLFVDCKNNSDFQDYNTIIYGHNMKNDSMFGTLTNYKEQKYFDEHREMYLFTENKNYKIEIFAGYITTSESEIYNFPQNSSTNEKLIKTALSKSTFKSEKEVSNEDKIITLSTCSYDFKKARYLILGVLKEIENK